MTKKYSYSTCLTLLILFFSSLFIQPLLAQDEVKVTGVVTESGTGQALALVSISVSSTGNSVSTDENGEFTISVPDLQAELIINLPGYNKQSIYLNGREYLAVSLVSSRYKSLNNSFNTPLGSMAIKDAEFSVNSFSAADLDLSNASSFDQTLEGKVPGLNVVRQSGMPGQRTYMNIRGLSSLYAENEPLLFIDGMIYDYSYAKFSLMDGFALNPMDIVDIDDISDITVIKDGLSYLGSAGSNGVINVNTEQKGETSSAIKFSAYGGISLAPEKQELLSTDEFKTYFTEVYNSRGLATSIDDAYPWLNGPATSTGYYKYNNDTDWQDEVFSPSAVSKFHFFLKGGDDIATYNISTGYLSHKGILNNSSYTRFNLRINGRINISDKFSVTPNAKLSLADSELANHGPNTWKNPLISAVTMPPIMAPYARNTETGDQLTYLDDVGNVFNNSNPTAIVENALGTNRNYHFLSSVKANYRFNDRFNQEKIFSFRILESYK